MVGFGGLEVTIGEPRRFQTPSITGNTEKTQNRIQKLRPKPPKASPTTL